MAAERSPQAPHRRTPWHTPFTPDRSYALDRAIVALEAAQTAPARVALRRFKELLEPQPQKAGAK